MPKKFKSINTPTGTIKGRPQIGRAAGISRQFFGYAEQRWVTCDSVRVLMPVPTAMELKQRIREGNAALDALSKVLMKRKRRVKTTFKPTTPLFQSDPMDPRLVIRILGKKQCRGTFVDGTFVTVA
jgi:hypothetical protein